MPDVVGLAGSTLPAQDTRPPATRAATSDEADKERRDYGGALSDRRYRALADIPPKNVDRLEFAWAQRTGDLAMTTERLETPRSCAIYIDPHRAG